LSKSFRLYLALVLVAALLLGGGIVLRDPRDHGTGPIAETTLAPEALLARGAYLATAGNCTSCHTAPDGEFMAGGLAFETPFGTIYSTNITPEADTGIGAWSERDFLNSMRQGVRPDGEHLYPAFPYTAFTKISNEDLAALWAWLRTVPAVRRANDANALSFPFGMRSLMAFWNTLYLQPGALEADPGRSEAWNRGAYLVEALGHCSACHSPRTLFGAEDRASAYGGGEYLDRVREGGHRPWSAPNLTSTERGLGLWSEEDIAAYLGTARNDFLETFGPMNEVVMNSTRHLDAGDLDAMATYLAGLPAVHEPAARAPSEQVMGRGRTVYNLHCGTCHLPTGEGDPEMAPRLNAGSLVVQDANPASMINVILYGPEAPRPALPPKWRHAMEEYQYLLDDEEIAAVATFVRNSWKNAAGPVTVEQVVRQR
jgi:mono/diheme cytochrome c family protein